MPGPGLAQDFQLGVVILAAGASVRMGRPKLLLPWGEKTILRHLVDVWREQGAAQIGVVYAAQSQGVIDELARIGAVSRICNPRPERGMFSSVQVAADWPGWPGWITHWLITLGDQPHLSTDTLRTLLDFARSQPACICQPAFRGRPRHPMVLPRANFLSLANTTEPDLKAFLAREKGQVRLCDIADPGLDLDLDTPDEYDKAMRMYLRKDEKSLPM